MSDNQNSSAPAPPNGPGGGQRRPAKGWLHRFLRKHKRSYGGTKKRTGYSFFLQVNIAAAILFLLIGVFWLVRPTYHRYMENRTAREAQTYLDHNDLTNALFSARVVLQRNPENLIALQVMTRLAALGHSPEELPLQQRLARLAPTEENQFHLAELGLHFQAPPFPAAAGALAALGDSATNNPRYHNLAAQLALGRQDLADAEAHFATAAALDPTNAHYALNLALFRLVLTNSTHQAEARACLEQLAVDPVYGAEALRGLIQDRLAHHDPAAGLTWSTELLAGPKATLRDQLQNLDLLDQLTNATFNAWLQGLKQAAQTNAPTAVALSAWMLARGWDDQLLTWLATLPAELQQLPPLQMARAEVYQDTGAWQQLKDYATTGNWGDAEFLRYAAISHAAAELGLPYDAIMNNWDLAVNETTGHFDAMKRLYDLAVRWHLKLEQTGLLERMVHEFPEQHGAVLALVQNYAVDGNTAALNQLYAWLNNQFPEDTGYQLGLAATSLMLQTNLPDAKAWTLTAHNDSPDNSQITTAYAYALHLDHRDAEGLAALEKLPAAALGQPAAALYYGVLLTAAGRTNEAATWLQKARTNSVAFLPEEKQLLAEPLAPTHAVAPPAGRKQLPSPWTL
jgi:Flp pilus assembly protein TadD